MHDRKLINYIGITFDQLLTTTPFRRQYHTTTVDVFTTGLSRFQLQLTVVLISQDSAATPQVYMERVTFTAKDFRNWFIFAKVILLILIWQL